MRPALVPWLAGALLLLAPAPAGTLIPRPIEVSGAPAGPEGTLEIAPALAAVEVGAATAVELDLTVTNRSPRPLDLELRVVPVAPGPDGAPEPATTAPPTGSAHAWIALPADAVHLDPQEQARIRPVVTVPDGTRPAGFAAALVVTATGAQPVTVHSLLLVDVPGGSERIDAEVTVAAIGRSDAVARLTVSGRGDTHRTVHGRLHLRSSLGWSVLDHELAPATVLAGTQRTFELRFTRPLLPGPVRVEAVITAEDGTVVVSTATVWLWHPAAVVVIVGLAAGGLAWALSRRRARRTRAQLVG